MDNRELDKKVKELVMADDPVEKERGLREIWCVSRSKGIHPASIHDFYAACGHRKAPLTYTVPAINLRTLSYDLARAVIRVAKKMNAGAFIFEIAKSEIGYTHQRPAEYAAVCLAAALREDYTGPIFIQGDHFQISAKDFRTDPDKQVETIKKLIKEAIGAVFYNIDIDSSTLVDLSKSDINEQQRLNYEVCADLTAYIRGLEPKGVTISVGGEIGEVGGKNSTEEELIAFMDGYRSKIGDMTGISKISIQTGTSHGGIPLPDGRIAEVKLDLDTLRRLSKLAREKYGLGGAVQHGASTLPSDAFHKFPEVGTVEVHLATEFQNMVYEHERFPSELKNEIYEWINQECIEEKKPDITDEQFIYKTRKKALGPFKKRIMNLPEDVRSEIAGTLERKFEFLFDQLKLRDTRKDIDEYVKVVDTYSEKSGSSHFVEVGGEGAD